MALGTSPNPLIKSTTKGLEVNKKGGIIVNEDGLTPRPAGGAAAGPFPVLRPTFFWGGPAGGRPVHPRVSEQQVSKSLHKKQGLSQGEAL